MSSYYQNVVEYFDQKAAAYDDVDQQLYWVLSDKFFKAVLHKELGADLSIKKNVQLLDAGAGTGRWTMVLEDLFGDKITGGQLMDISPKMLAEAEKKIIQKGLDKKYSCSVGNIEDLSSIADEKFDWSISFYNVISFVERPGQALSEISKKLKTGGLHISIVVNKYHAYYFSILTNRLKELDSIRATSKIRFNDDMPAIHCFTPDEARKIYLDNGFSEVRVLGGPNFIYPGMEETKVHGSTEQITNKLTDTNNFDKILDLELAHYADTNIVGRSNALLIIAKK